MVKKIYNYFMGDSLYSNSIYLMASTFMVSVFGFFFWLINARFHNPEQIGIATTVISIINLLSGFTVLGLNSGIIKYLPNRNNKNGIINTAFTLVGCCAAIIAIIYLLGIHFFPSRLSFLASNNLYIVSFIIIMIIYSVNLLTDNIFIAYRSTKYVLMYNTIFNLIKIVLPFILISLGYWGILISIYSATFICLIIAIIFLKRKFNYIFYPIININTIKIIGKFSFSIYIINLLSNFSLLIMPVIITNSLGPKFSAYFYMALMITNFLYIIPTSVSQSLFAEGSYDTNLLKTQIIKASKITAMILVPAILVTIFFGNYILVAFGKSYALEGFVVLQMFAITGIFISISTIITTLMKIKHQLKQLIIVSIIGNIIIISLTYLFLSRGLVGVGIGWIISNALITLINFLTYKASNSLVFQRKYNIAQFISIR
jgi:O-antigen/teichoic acid export membrane protein